MDRRKFIKASASVSILGSLSGCLDQVQDRVPFWNDEEMTEIYPKTITNLIPPNDDYTESTGRIAIEIDNSLSNSFDNMYEDPFVDYSTEIESLLHSRSALSVIRPTIEDGISGHPGESDILTQINLSDSNSSVGQIERFGLSEDIIFFNGKLDTEVIKSVWDVSRVESEDISHQYKLYENNNKWIAVGKDWFVIPIDDYSQSDIINRTNNFVQNMNGSNVDTTIKNIHDSVSRGSVNIVESGTDLEFVENDFNTSATDILNTSNFTQGNLSTTTSIKFSESVQKSDIEETISSISGEYTVTVNDTICIINVDW